MKLSSHKLPWMVQALLYGTCVLTLVNSGGLFVLLVQQTQLSARLVQAEGRLQEISESSVVEFLSQVRGPEDQEEQYQSSRNKRSQELHHAQEELLHAQELPRGQAIHRAEQQGDMMMMMTYSMVPVRQTPCWLNIISHLFPSFSIYKYNFNLFSDNIVVMAYYYLYYYYHYYYRRLYTWAQYIMQSFPFTMAKTGLLE